MTTLKQVRVVIASPSDVKEEREALNEVVNRINRNTAERQGLVLKAVRWETDSYPGFHIDGPQGLIDPILKIDDCDILICIFWKRFGTITEDGKTGTEHEFYKAYEAWKQNKRPQLMLYFSQKAYSPKEAEDLEQHLAVLKFRKNLPKEGLHWDYDGIEQFKEYVYDHLTNYLQDHFNKKSVSQINQPSVITISNQEIEKILNTYVNSLEKKVSKIRLLGDNKEYDLNEVFVDLIINEEYERPSSSQTSNEYMHLLDYELRKKRILFSDLKKEDDDDESKEGKDKEKKKIKPEDLLKSNKKTTIIVGAPGSGKSTLLRYIVNKILKEKEKEYFPVYLELKNIQRDEIKDEDRFEDIIFSEAVISQIVINDKAKEKSILKILRDKLTDGKIAFFLDGLDEMKETDNSHNVSLRNLFNKFVESEYISNNLVIVMTRAYALQGRNYSYRVQQMEIVPFDTEQIKQFITHYFKGNNPSAKRFLDVLSTRSEIQELARVPLILGFLLQMYIKSKSFSENKLDIYDNIVTSLNKQLDEEKGVKRNFKITNPIHRLRILTSLAFSGLLNFHDKISNRFVFPQDKILDEVRKYCIENTHLNIDDLFEDIKMTALLREIGNDTYAFTHLTIQEYLAATTLVKDKNLAKLFCQAYFDPTMCEMEVLPMTIGLSQSGNDNTTINMYELLEKLPESLNFANLRLRVKGLGYSPLLVDEKHLSQIADRLIEFVTEKNIDETSYKQIIFNVFSSSSEKNKRYISQPLLELLKKHDRNQSLFYIKNLIYVLGKLQNKDAISGLVDLLKDENTDIRSAAAEALSGTQDKDAISGLVDLLKDENTDIRRTAAEALSGTQDKDAVSELVDLLKDEEAYVRHSAAFALIGTQDKDAVSELVDLLKDEDSDVRESAAAALEGYDLAILSKGLLMALSYDDIFVREKSISVIGYYSNEDGERKLQEIINNNDQNEEIKKIAEIELEKLQFKMQMIS